MGWKLHTFLTLTCGSHLCPSPLGRAGVQEEPPGGHGMGTKGQQSPAGQGAPGLRGGVGLSEEGGCVCVCVCVC